MKISAGPVRLLLMPLCSMLVGLSPAIAGDERTAVIGQPVGLTVQPATVKLHGPLAMQQLVVTGRYAQGPVRDLTGACEMSLETKDLIQLEPGGFLMARKNGKTVLTVKAGGQSATVAVEVTGADQPVPVSFRRHFVAALNVGGCNAGACHGTPSGKGGFRLSLRGFDPAADFLELTREEFGRRTNRFAPDASLMLQKALGRVPHEGGQRFRPDSVPARMIQTWLHQGLGDDPKNLPALKKVEILPGQRVALAPARWQQLAVLAHFADGSVQDVTRLTVFSSSDAAIASVTPGGLVEFSQAGEVAILCRYLDNLQALRLTYLDPGKDFRWVDPPENNYVDKHVFTKLKMLSIAPSDLCTDQEFIRRVYLDICGILPEAAEIKQFLASTDAKKRAKLIDALLDRPEYADFWTMKWSDVLRSSRKTVQYKGIHGFQHWVRKHVVANTPFDEVVRELLIASGNTFANPPANYYRIARDPQNLAETTAQLFMGIRMQCCKCHNHPFERWTQDDYYSLAAFFARVRQKNAATEIDGQPAIAEVIFSDRAGEVGQPRTNQIMAPKFPGGALATVPPGTDRREVLARWLTAAENPYFARSVVNRVWYHLNGRGIVEPVDDFRDSNPAANDELLDALTRDFVFHRFNVKQLIRTIANSRTYQLSAQGNASNKEDRKYFSHALTRLVPAEPLLDAICKATGMPEKFAGMPAGTRAVQLPDGDFNHPFLKTFGQPGRELACECERESDSNLAQALQLINGATVNEKTRAPNNRIGQLLAKNLPPAQILEELYLATLSRPPLEGEIKAALEHVEKAPDDKGKGRRQAWEDIQWALFNHKEFMFRH